MTTIISNKASSNCLTNLYARELGLLSTIKFITYSNTQRVEDIKLSKTRSIASSSHSINWLNLDNVENRLYRILSV